MPALYDYSQALTLMKRKGVYAIAAPTGQKNEVFFVGEDGCLRVYKPIPGYPTTDVAVNSPYTLQQLETSGWMILDYYHSAADRAFRGFSGKLNANIAAVSGVLDIIQEKTDDLDLRAFFETAEELLTETRKQIEKYERLSAQEKERLSKESEQ